MLKQRIVILAAGVFAIALGVIATAQTGGTRQAPKGDGAVSRTPWGDPDLQGEWTSEGEYGVPFSARRNSARDNC